VLRHEKYRVLGTVFEEQRHCVSEQIIDVLFFYSKQIQKNLGQLTKVVFRSDVIRKTNFIIGVVDSVVGVGICVVGVVWVLAAVGDVGPIDPRVGGGIVLPSHGVAHLESAVSVGCHSLNIFNC